MTFGDYPLVGLKEARELHFAAKKLLATGVNPMAERKAKAEAKQEEAKAVQHELRTVLRTCPQVVGVVVDWQVSQACGNFDESA